jgi:hypothetical protein
VYAALAAPPRLQSAIVECLAFNAPGFCPEFMARYKAAMSVLAGRIQLYQNRFDVVSSLLADVVEPKIISSLYAPLQHEKDGVFRFFYPHSNFVFASYDDGGLIPDSEGKSGLCGAVREFSLLFLRLPVEIRREACGIILERIYGGEAPVSAALEVFAGYLARKASADKKFALLTSAAFSAKMLANQDFDSVLAKEETSTSKGLLILIKMLAESRGRPRGAASSPAKGTNPL